MMLLTMAPFMKVFTHKRITVVVAEHPEYAKPTHRKAGKIIAEEKRREDSVE